MKDSDIRIQFITDYLSAYEEKVRLLNQHGLFDSAKLFELFAIEVGRLYFGQEFTNLNMGTYTYPCVDLISEDNQTYMQVSTAKDIPAKIKRTLEKIRDSKRDDIKNIRQIRFFVMSNESLDKVKDYTGADQIGKISFTKESCLTTTKDIIEKATSDIGFQLALYELLKKESDSIKDNTRMLIEAAEDSKNAVKRNIDCKINNEHEIDREDFLAKIKSDGSKNISIQGDAGSGKSAICMKLSEESKFFVYARAERFLEENSINKIWGFNVRQTLEGLNNKPIVFFIDALEFIADVPTKLDLLCVLYDCAEDYPAAKIITSCRTSDKNAFFKIESNYQVKTYEVPELTVSEQLEIARKYLIIQKMFDMNSYAELLKSPFYINLIVSKITDIDNISDENQLREYIWQHIICLNDNRIKKIIESIVFTRAKDFSVGVCSTNYDRKDVEKLLSESILVENGSTIRLKYDIFEDICFEQYLDREFDKCKGRYEAFFHEIGIVGRCIYRRYQIWISNKLLAKVNRDRFISELVFSDKMPLFWRKQTEIGLVKSRFSAPFFKEYGLTIQRKGSLDSLIKATNLYAFEIESDSLTKLLPFIQLKPCGEGRKSFIHLIVESRLYEHNDVSQAAIKKLCSDYSKLQNKDKHTAEEASLILEYFIEKHISGTDENKLYMIDEVINNLLAPVYQMAMYSKSWITEFWEKLIAYYKGDNWSLERFAVDIINYTIKNEHTQLAMHLPRELCDLAEIFWTHSNKGKHRRSSYGFYERDDEKPTSMYGLSENAENYQHGSSQGSAFDGNFFRSLFRTSFWIGLNWTIEFINRAVTRLSEKLGGDLQIYDVFLVDNNDKKSYLGNGEMWLVTTQKCKVPMVISDLIYCLKVQLRFVIKHDAVKDNETAVFANNVKNLILNKSNNILLLSVIADIGMEFPEKLPGFALDLATNIRILRNDFERSSPLDKNPTMEMLKEQILLAVGIPASLLPDRYKTKESKQFSLLSYFITSQVYCGKDTAERCHEILDYLYSIEPNDLLIQDMDMRTAQADKIDDSTSVLLPTITGEAEKVVIGTETARQPDEEISSIINECIGRTKSKKLALDDCLRVIEVLIDAIKKTDVSVKHEKLLILFIATALQDNSLDRTNRDRYSQLWIDGIKRYFRNDSFIFDYGLSIALFKQVEMNDNEDITCQIKQLILDLLVFDQQHGAVSEIAKSAKLYLSTNCELATAVFNTILKLAEYEFEQQKIDAVHLDEDDETEVLEKLQRSGLVRRVSIINFNDSRRRKYESRRDEIVKRYLVQNEQLDVSQININQCDISTICYSINCGLSLDNSIFAGFTKELVLSMIDVWKAYSESHESYRILGVDALSGITQFFQKEILKNSLHTSMVLAILFDDIDFSKFTKETIDFYLDVFSSFLAEYFDAHNDKEKRVQYESIILSLEDKIIAINNNTVKTELYKTLILSGSRSGGSGDWSKYPSGYSYQDKQFLNNMFSKYGGYHIEELFYTVYRLQIDKLLPEIILSMRDAFKIACGISSLKNQVSNIPMETKVIILMIITRAFLDFSDYIKQDYELTKAFEELLEILVELYYEEAATILDEFRIH